LEIPVEMVQFLLKLLLKQISCCAPPFPLILTTKFHSLCVKESELEILERLESDILERSDLESGILPPILQPCLQGCQWQCNIHYKISPTDLGASKWR